VNIFSIVETLLFGDGSLSEEQNAQLSGNLREGSEI
jgi:hypothetical protein